MNYDDIKHELNNADIVSFDIFDTLITRLVLHSRDVLAIAAVLAEKHFGIEFDLRQEREDAEAFLLKTSDKNSYNITDIYSYIGKKYNLKEETCKGLSDIELEVESKVVIPRKDVLDLFEELHSNGKKIILTSDMYLSSFQIRSLLSACGYNTDNVDIFISNEFNASKADGSLWEKVSERYKSKKIVHIGDNRQSDDLSAKKYGITSVLIQSSAEKFQQSEMFSTLSVYDDGTAGNSLLLGRLCNGLLFNNAFSDRYDNKKALGFFNGPVFSCFMRWLINTRDDSLLLFVTREGYIFRPMYQAYCENAEVKPQKNCLFYTSRQAVSRASIRNIKDLEDLLSMPYEGTLIDFVKQKCGCGIENCEAADMSISLPGDKYKLLKLLNDFLPEIVSNSKKSGEIYKQYINELCSKFNCDKITIVDIGWFGTTQFLMTKITDKELKGKYLITDANIYEPIINDVSSLGKISEGNHPVHDNLHFFESSIHVPYGQLLSVDKDENGKLMFDFKDADRIPTIILDSQKECLEFSKEDAKWFGFIGNDYNYSLALAEDIWICMLYYNYLPTEYINSFSFDDAFNGNEMFVYDPDSHVFKTSDRSIPIVFHKNKNEAFKKVKLKNFVKRHTPYFLYMPLKKIWMRFIK